MLVQELENSAVREWDDFLQSSFEGTFYHTLEWKEVIERSFPHTPFYLTIRDEGKGIVGVCPAFLLNKLQMIICDSTPYSDYGGPVIAQHCIDEASRCLLSFLQSAGRDRGIAYAKMRLIDEKTVQCFQSPHAFLDATTGVMELSLKNTSSDLIWTMLSKNVRKRFKAIEGKGFRATEARTRSDLRQFYDLYFRNMKHIGVSPFPFRFVQNMWDLLHPENLRIWFLENHKRVAGTLFLKDKRASYAYLTGLDRGQGFHEAINYLRWAEIRKSEEDRCAYVSFGSTPSDPTNPYHVQKTRIGGSFRRQNMVWHPLSSTGRLLIRARPPAVATWRGVRRFLPLYLRGSVERRLKRF